MSRKLIALLPCLVPTIQVPHNITTISEEETPLKTEKEQIQEELVGLPAPHTAAALGDLKRLEGFESVEASLLSSFDTDRRTPLFYASAYAQEAVVAFLLRVGEEVVGEADLNGDTALHAATSAGSTACVELILKCKGDVVRAKNQIGMTPAHLARTADCLRVLYQYGADLTQTDRFHYTISYKTPFTFSDAFHSRSKIYAKSQIILHPLPTYHPV